MATDHADNAQKRPDNESSPTGQASSTPEAPAALTAEQARILLRADLKNLARKVQLGRTLSASERNVLNATLAGGTPSTASFAKNQVELAEILGISRKTIQRAKKEKDAPRPQPDGRLDVAAWREFFRGKGRHLDSDDSEEAMTQSKLRCRNILLQNEKLEFQLGVLRRDFVPAREVEKWGAQLGGAIRKVVSQIHLAAPSVVGVSVPEAEARLKETEDEILEQLHLLDQSIDDWQNSIHSPAADEPAP